MTKHYTCPEMDIFFLNANAALASSGNPESLTNFGTENVGGESSVILPEWF